MSCNNKDLDFIKLTALPPTVEPNKAYLIKENEAAFTMYMTDKDCKVYGLDPSVYTLDFNEETNILRLRNAGGVVSQVDLSSLAQAEGVVSVDVQGVTINFRDSAGDVIDSIQLGVSNIVGLQDDLDEKEDITNKVTDLNNPNNLEYPTTQAVYEALQGFVPDLTDYVSYNPQSKTELQKQQARTNIGVYSTQEIQDFLDGSTPINGYNKTNWDTAFGWGNHASAGYAVLNVMNTGTLTASNLSGTNTGDQTLSGLGGEPAFTKNTAFNKNFGTTAGTVAQGNDSRINNGQTAFGWGDWSVGVTKAYIDSLNVDADTLDGLDSTDFVTVAGVQNITGNKAFTNGITLPNVVDEGSIVTTSTRIPIIGIDGSVNSYADLDEILALNPPPPTPTLQEVTDVGSTITNTITTTKNFVSRRSDGEFVNTLSPNGLLLNHLNSAEQTFINYSLIEFHNSIGGATRVQGTDTAGLKLSTSTTNNSSTVMSTKLRVNYGNNETRQGGSPEDIVAVEIMGRAKGVPAVNNDELVTLGQMQDGISNVTITESQITDLKDYLRGDINDTNGANKLTLGSLEVVGQTILQNGLNMSSVPVGTSDNILTLNQTTGDVEQRVFSLGDIDIANGAGTNQFPVGLGDQLRFAGSGDTSVSFNDATNTVTITSVPGSGTGGAVTSFNGRTGGVVSEAGDYSTAMVNELTNLYFTEPRVRETPLTGLTIANTPISATNTFLQALGRLQGQINDRSVLGHTHATLTRGSGLTGSNYNGGAATTWAINPAYTGFTNYYNKTESDGRYSLLGHTHTFSSITNKPTSLSGYGITDAYTKTVSDGRYVNVAGDTMNGSLIVNSTSADAITASINNSNTGLFLLNTGTGRAAIMRTYGGDFITFRNQDNVNLANISGTGYITGANLSGINTGDQSLGFSGGILSISNGNQTNLDDRYYSISTSDSRFLNQTNFFTKASGQLRFNDGVRLQFGNSAYSDLRFEDGNMQLNIGNSSSTGNFVIREVGNIRHTFERDGDYIATGGITAKNFPNANLSNYISLNDFDDGTDALTGIKSYVRDGKWLLYPNTNETNPISIEINGTLTANKLSIVSDVTDPIQVEHTGSASTMYLTNSGSGRVAIFDNTGTGNINTEYRTNSIWTHRIYSNGTFVTTNDITSGGLVYATGGNSTQWNAAYGWGNHASAGYVPSSRTISTGGGLSGGGNLTANRTLSVDSTVARTNVAETFSSTVTATNFILSSDRRLKENIESLGNGYYTFNFIDDETKRKRYGAMADEVKEYAPELIYENEEGYEQVGYIDFLIKKVAELENKINNL